jgi:oxepin-CoA hydrolase/3-oxo-5,6-dehydrosuberyl-CoA semialdehyde dehydrogenase
MPYQNTEHAMTLARAGEGSLAGTLVTASGELAREFILVQPAPTGVFRC